MDQQVQYLLTLNVIDIQYLVAISCNEFAVYCMDSLFSIIISLLSFQIIQIDDTLTIPNHIINNNTINNISNQLVERHQCNYHLAVVSQSPLMLPTNDSKNKNTIVPQQSSKNNSINIGQHQRHICSHINHNGINNHLNPSNQIVYKHIKHCTRHTTVPYTVSLI